MNLLMMLLGIAILIVVSLVPGEQFVISMAAGALFGIGVGLWVDNRMFR